MIQHRFMAFLSESVYSSLNPGKCQRTPQIDIEDTMNEPYSALREPLVRVIDQWSRGTEDCSTPIPNLSFFRREAPAAPAYCMIKPSIVLVVQGAKQMLVGNEAYAYDISRFLITSLDLPASSEVVRASPEAPCLGLTLTLDLRTIAELIAHGDVPQPRKHSVSSSIGLGIVTPVILEPLKRLLALLSEPAAIPTLAPIFQRELHYRLLTSEQGPRLRQIASVDGQGYRIAKTIDWLKNNYASPLRVEDLAESAHMSTATFHHHFRQLTAMSPLQYQKWLRLNEAKRLMLNEHQDAATAAFNVGYESPSQFSREYCRLFGSPPKRDIAALRNTGSAGQSKLKGKV